MRTISISMSEIDFKKLGLQQESITYKELAAIIKRELLRENLVRCVEMAEKYGLSGMTMDEITNEVRAVRNATNSD